MGLLISCVVICVCLLLIKRYNRCKVLACSTAFFQLSLFCAIFFHLCIFIFLLSSRTSFSQLILGLPIGLLDMGFHLLIFWTLLSSAMRSTWPNQFNLCFLINPIIFRPFSISLISWLLLILLYIILYYVLQSMSYIHDQMLLCRRRGPGVTPLHYDVFQILKQHSVLIFHKLLPFGGNKVNEAVWMKCEDFWGVKLCWLINSCWRVAVRGSEDGAICSSETFDSCFLVRIA
jgi:hypothetical protein